MRCNLLYLLLKRILKILWEFVYKIENVPVFFALKTIRFIPIQTFVLGNSFIENFAKKFQCTTCQNVYTHRSTLLRHLKYACGKVATIHCPYCWFKAKYPFSLKTHMAVVHPNMGK